MSCEIIISNIYQVMKKPDESIHIPCGFRCHTKSKMSINYKIKNHTTFPFDNGFWSPYSIKKNTG
jgi:hypothetical protein